MAPFFPVERPHGVTLMAFGYFLIALLCALLWLFLAIQSLANGRITETRSVLALIGLLLIVLYTLGVGVGLWRCNAWAWWLTVVTYGADLISNLWRNGDESFTSERLFDVGLRVVVIAYFMRSKIRRAFRVRLRSSPFED